MKTKPVSKKVQRRQYINHIVSDIRRRLNQSSNFEVTYESSIRERCSPLSNVIPAPQGGKINIFIVIE